MSANLTQNGTFAFSGCFRSTLPKSHVVNSKLNPKRIFLQEYLFSSVHVPQRRWPLCRFYSLHHCGEHVHPSVFQKCDFDTHLNVTSSVETCKRKTEVLYCSFNLYLSNAVLLIKIVQLTTPYGQCARRDQLTWNLCR